jgi:hypothetical protein
MNPHQSPPLEPYEASPPGAWSSLWQRRYSFISSAVTDRCLPPRDFPKTKQGAGASEKALS